MKSLFLDHRSAKNCIHMNEWVLDSMHRIQFSLNTLNHLRFPMLSNNKHLFQTFRMIIINTQQNSDDEPEKKFKTTNRLNHWNVSFYLYVPCHCFLSKWNVHLLDAKIQNYPLVDEYHKISLSPIHSTCSKYHYFEYLFLFCFQNNIKINTKTKHFYIRQSYKPK